jgi:hypothetical protein
LICSSVPTAKPRPSPWEALARSLLRQARSLDARDDLGLELTHTLYALDRGYMDFRRLHRIARAGAFFVTRAKDNLRFSLPRRC